MDSHVRYMGAMFAGYGIAWLDAAAGERPLAGKYAAIVSTYHQNKTASVRKYFVLSAAMPQRMKFPRNVSSVR